MSVTISVSWRLWHSLCSTINMSPYGISYEARAEECRRRAAEANWPPDRQDWTELAQAWLRLAQSTDVRSVPGAILPLDVSLKGRRTG
jgi:hypothetical protein